MGDIFFAIKTGDFVTVSCYLDNGKDVNAIDPRSNANLLYYACFFRKLAIVKRLVSRGADLHSRTNIGFTALHISCVNIDLRIVHFLIAAGASLFSRTNNESTAFHIACLHNNLKIACYLAPLMIEKGINIHTPNKKGLTPLHQACIDGFLKIVKMLLSLGADPYALTPEGENAFNLACKYNRKEIVEYLGSLMLLN